MISTERKIYLAARERVLLRPLELAEQGDRWGGYPFAGAPPRKRRRLMRLRRLNIMLLDLKVQLELGAYVPALEARVFRMMVQFRSARLRRGFIWFAVALAGALAYHLYRGLPPATLLWGAGLFALWAAMEVWTIRALAGVVSAARAECVAERGLPLAG